MKVVIIVAKGIFANQANLAKFAQSSQEISTYSISASGGFK